VVSSGPTKEALKLEEIGDPPPEPAKVVVEVEAAAMNLFDIPSRRCRGP
jgi:NADPH:quinone reductase-like Zn-dependent oxidoreductase